MDKEEIKHLNGFAKRIQMETLKAIASIGVGHVGGSLSIAHVLAVLYGKEMRIDPANPHCEQRDWFVLSKGHCGPALYATLALKGYFPVAELQTINRPGTILPSQCDRNKTPGIDMTTGSLGQGASSAAGIALAHKINHQDNRVYLIMGDGECQEGQVWEMALFAAQQKLDHLIAFIDRNRIQLDGFTDDVNSIGDIRTKFADFGWYSQEVDGHDVAAIDAAIQRAKKNVDQPAMIILNTIKGQGWHEIENTVKSHSMTISKADLERALLEMNLALKEMEAS